MEENKMEVFNELIKYEPNFLDRPLKDLVPLRFLGEVAVDAYKALIKRIDNIPMAQEEREAILADGQDAGKALLSIEAKIGQLVLILPKGVKKNGDTGIKAKKGELAKANLDGQKSFRAKMIYEHPEEVEEVIKEAEENQDIPTKTAVLNKIKLKKVEKINEELIKQTPPKPDVNNLLDNCIKKVYEINSVLKEIVKYRDNCEVSKMDEFVTGIKRMFEILQTPEKETEGLKLIK